jgi:hypothetical protein
VVDPVVEELQDATGAWLPIKGSVDVHLGGGAPLEFGGMKPLG